MEVAAVFELSVEFINGLKFGIEHLSRPEMEDDDPDEVWPVYAIVVDILCIRLAFWRYA